VCGELCCSVESPRASRLVYRNERGLEIENLKGVMLLRVLNGSTSASTTGDGIANRVPGRLAHSSIFGLGASVRRIGESCGSSGYKRTSHF
jgi:hypothetical protein